MKNNLDTIINSFRIETDVKKVLIAQAKKSDRTLTNLIQRILRQAADMYQKK